MNIHSLVFFVVVWALSPCSLLASEDTLWVKAIFAQSVGGSGPFILNNFEQHGLHVTGKCSYKQSEKQPALIIEGTKTYNGEFWPDITGQVKNEKTGAWETVSLPLDYGNRATVEVKPGEVRQDLLVTLDVFVPLVGKYKVGRVLLKTGEAAEFDLFELLPDPEYKRRTGGKN